MLLFGKPLQGFRHPSLQTPFEAENGYQENQWLECLVLLGQEWMDKMARRVPHYINILGKHPLGKNVRNILEGLCLKYVRDKGWKPLLLILDHATPSTELLDLISDSTNSFGEIVITLP